jgi:putative inorganic carbon (HCO3(-)) transporter
LGIAILGVFGTSWISNKIPSFQKIIAHLPRLITGLQGANAGFHPNEVAGALIWLLPLMLVLSISMLFLLWRRKNIDMRSMGEHKQVKLLGWRVAGVTISCLAMTFFITAVFVLSQSRGAYLGLMTTLILLILIAWQPRLRWYSLVFLALLTIALGIGFSLHRDAVRVWISGSSINGTPGLSLYTLKDRLEVWSRAIYGIQDFPFTGMGMNTFRKVMPVLYPLFTVFLEGGDIGHAHNEFLQAALDLGIPGLIAFFALYVGSFWMLIDVWRTTRSSSIDNKNQFLVTRSLTLGLGGGLLAHLLYGLTDAVALGAKPGVLFWILLGLIVGLYQQVRDHESVGFGDNPSMEPKKDYGHD